MLTDACLNLAKERSKQNELNFVRITGNARNTRNSEIKRFDVEISLLHERQQESP